MSYYNQILQDPFHKGSEDLGGRTAFTNKEDNNPPVIFEHYTIDDPKWSVDAIRQHDTHELLIFVGSDPTNIRDIGAEIHLSLGEDNEEQIINDTTVIIIPPGLKNGHISVHNYNRPFNLLRIINSKAWQEEKTKAQAGESDFHEKALLEGSQVAKHGKKYWMNTMRGPLFIDYEPGWTGTSIWAHHDEFRAGVSLGYHCVVTPYDVRMSHGHDFHENLAFLSGDPANPGDLGAEVKVCLGDDQEEHYFNKPGIISMPAGLKHCPMLVHNIKKPVIFLEVSATAVYKGKPEDV